jgi:hypothetical protein
MVPMNKQMQIYNGIYSWDGKRHGNREPIAWFPGSYSLQIFDIGKDRAGVTSLKQHLCIYAETGSGHSISAHPEKFAKQVCLDFSLDLERVLWVEKLPVGGERYEVVVYSRSSKMGDTMFYRVLKRPPTDIEMQIIAAELQKIDG